MSQGRGMDAVPRGKKKAPKRRADLFLTDRCPPPKCSGEREVAALRRKITCFLDGFIPSTEKGVIWRGGFIPLIWGCSSPALFFSARKGETEMQRLRRKRKKKEEHNQCRWEQFTVRMQQERLRCCLRGGTSFAGGGKKKKDKGNGFPPRPESRRCLGRENFPLM